MGVDCCVGRPTPGIEPPLAPLGFAFDVVVSLADD